MKLYFGILALVLTLVSAGCVALPKSPGPNAASPASPGAKETPFRPAPSLLLAGENYAMGPEAEGQPMEMDMKDMKMDMPGMENMKDMKGMKMDKPAPGTSQAKPSPHEGHETAPKTAESPTAAPNPHQHHQDNAPKP